MKKFSPAFWIPSGANGLVKENLYFHFGLCGRNKTIISRVYGYRILSSCIFCFVLPTPGRILFAQVIRIIVLFDRFTRKLPQPPADNCYSRSDKQSQPKGYEIAKCLLCRFYCPGILMKTVEHATAGWKPMWVYLCNSKSFKTVTNGSVNSRSGNVPRDFNNTITITPVLSRDVKFFDTLWWYKVNFFYWHYLDGTWRFSK